MYSVFVFLRIDKRKTDVKLIKNVGHVLCQKF